MTDMLQLHLTTVLRSTGLYGLSAYISQLKSDCMCCMQQQEAEEQQERLEQISMCTPLPMTRQLP